jgi:hypothetical protein
MASALWFGDGGGRRRPAGSVAGAFTRRKRIPRNTPRARAGRRREATAQEGMGRHSEEGKGRPVGPGGPKGQKGLVGLIKGRNKKGFDFKIYIDFRIWQDLEVGMATGRVRVGWTENSARGEIESGQKLHPHPHPRVKFHTRTRQVSGASRVPGGFVNGPAQFSTT